MKALILAAFVAVVLGAGMSYASTDLVAYHTPANNYQQNNWVSG